MTNTQLPSMSDNRLRWLRKLARDGRCSWEDMPKQKHDRRSASHMTWRPMVSAGWITAEFTGDPVTWWFEITDQGRKILEAYR